MKRFMSCDKKQHLLIQTRRQLRRKGDELTTDLVVRNRCEGILVEIPTAADRQGITRPETHCGGGGFTNRPCPCSLVDTKGELDRPIVSRPYASIRLPQCRAVACNLCRESLPCCPSSYCWDSKCSKDGRPRRHSHLSFARNKLRLGRLRTADVTAVDFHSYARVLVNSRLNGLIQAKACPAAVLKGNIG